MSAQPPGQGKYASRCVRVIAGRKVTFDDEGFFDDFEDWSEEIFEALAHESGISRIVSVKFAADKAAAVKEENKEAVVA